MQENYTNTTCAIIHLGQMNIPFKKWIDRNKVVLHRFCENPSSIKWLVNNQKIICWDSFSLNESDEALDLLFQNVNKINWNNLCMNKNPRAIELISLHLSSIQNQLNKYELSKNPNAIDFLYMNTKFMDIYGLCENVNPEVIGLIESKYSMEEIVVNIVQNKYADKYIGYYYLQIKSGILHPYIEYSFWRYLQLNPSENALKLLTFSENVKYIDWNLLCGNIGNMAIESFIMENNEFIVWEELLKTPLGEKCISNVSNINDILSLVDFYNLTQNEYCVFMLDSKFPHILETYKTHICWESVSKFKCIVRNCVPLL